MKFRAFYVSAQEIPKDQASFYRKAVETDGLPEGAFVLDLELPNGWELRDTSKLARSLAESREEKKHASEELERMRSSFGGMDPADIGRKLKKLQDLEAAGTDGNARAAAAHAAQIEELTRKHKEALDAEQQRTAALEGDLNTLHHRTEIGDAIGSARANKAKVQAHVRATTRVDAQKDKDGQVRRRTVVLDERGEVRKVIDKKTGEFREMTVGELLDEMKGGDWASDFEPEKGEPGERRGANLADSRSVGMMNGKPIRLAEGARGGRTFEEALRNPGAGLDQRMDTGNPRQ